MAEHTHPQASQGQVAKSAAAGRAANGRFAKGNLGGPGNPYGRQVAELRKLVLAKVTPEVLADVIDGLIGMARLGDVSAARVILQYSLGAPMPASSPDRVEHEDWELRASRPTVEEMHPVVMGRPPL